MHTHFAAPQKRGYTHTLGLAPLPREPIDTSISNHGFPMHKHMMATMLRQEAFTWRNWTGLDGGSGGGNGEDTPFPNVRSGDFEPKKESKPHWPPARNLMEKVTGFFWGENFFSPFFGERSYIWVFHFQKKFRIFGLFFHESRGLQVLQMATAGDLSQPTTFPPFFFPLPTPSCRCVK